MTSLPQMFDFYVVIFELIDTSEDCDQTPRDRQNGGTDATQVLNAAPSVLAPEGPATKLM